MSEAIHRTNPPINAMDFGVPPLFAERAENYARWAVAAEREACAKACVADLIESPTKFEVAAINKCAAAIRARSKA